uniref:CSON010168 protein n=1 Tax=Culicoides sonorensis TaxID=179676 RepID=A0A336LPL4_CULSO
MKTTMAPTKKPQDPQPLGPKKTLLVMVTVVGCIAVLWPKIFQPMLFNTAPKPNVIKDHRGSGCCDVVLDTEEFANTSSAMQLTSERPTFRKHLKLFTEEMSIRQERPPHLRADGIHPAMRERGRAIHPSLPTIPITGDRPHVPPINAKIIDGRPGPIPGMRPPMGAGSHPQGAQKASSMGFIMPLYTIGIVAFFVYTIMKLVCKKSPTAPYEPVKADPRFRQKVFSSDENEPLIKRPDDGTTKLGWKDHDASYIYHPDYLADSHLYENGHHLHHYLPLHHTPSIYKNVTTNDSLEKKSNTNGTESKVAFVAPLESRTALVPLKIKGDKNIDQQKNDKNNKYSEKTNEKCSEDKKDIINDSLEITRIELEYKLKEKQQLLEIELLRQRLAETERAMANIISKMDKIPTQGQKDKNGKYLSFVTAIQGIIDAANEQILEHKLKEKQQLQKEFSDNLPNLSKDTTTNSNTQNGSVKQLENGNLHNDDDNHNIDIIAQESDAKEQTSEKKKRDNSRDRGQVQHDKAKDEPEEELNPIYIQTPVDADSKILVADTNETAEELFDENELEDDPAVVLSGRMTLSLISPRIGSPIASEKQNSKENGSTENLTSNFAEKGEGDKEMNVEVSNIVVMEKMEH